MMVAAFVICKCSTIFVTELNSQRLSPMHLPRRMLRGALARNCSLADNFLTQPIFSIGVITDHLVICSLLLATDHTGFRLFHLQNVNKFNQTSDGEMDSKVCERVMLKYQINFPENDAIYTNRKTYSTGSSLSSRDTLVCRDHLNQKVFLVSTNYIMMSSEICEVAFRLHV